MSRLVEGGILTVLFFLVVNVVFLNIFFIAERSKKPAAMTVVVEENKESLICDELCQQAISERLMAKITPVIQSSAKGNVERGMREFIIPLGSGTASSKEYEQVAGVEAYIDTSLYPGIKTVFFETYMFIPTANGFAFAKLFNVTDKHDVWYSEQSMETNTITMKESTITLDPGKKLYRVMVKSTMGYEVKLNNARIRIITE